MSRRSRSPQGQALSGPSRSAVRQASGYEFPPFSTLSIDFAERAKLAESRPGLWGLGRVYQQAIAEVELLEVQEIGVAALPGP